MPSLMIEIWLSPFLLSTVIAVPGMILLIWVAPWHVTADATAEASAESGPESKPV